VTFQRRILFRRHLSRLRSNRSIAIGLAFGILVLLLIALTIYVGAGGRIDLASDLAFVVRQRFWSSGSLFGALVFVFAIVLGSTMVNDDIKAGTIFGILARPVSRTDYFLGSWYAAAAFLSTLELMRCVAATGSVFALERGVSGSFLVAMLATVAGDVLRLALFAALGAVFSSGVAVLAGISLLIVESFAFAPKIPPWVGYPLRGIGVFLPLSSHQDALVTKTLLGEARQVAPLLEITAYRLCWTVALVAMGIWAFQRREVAPRV
jgi:ABC-type transport system involved in multi-copper enzyme maturation permease subunit